MLATQVVQRMEATGKRLRKTRVQGYTACRFRFQGRMVCIEDILVGVWEAQRQLLSSLLGGVLSTAGEAGECPSLTSIPHRDAVAKCMHELHVATDRR